MMLSLHEQMFFKLFQPNPNLQIWL